MVDPKGSGRAGFVRVIMTILVCLILLAGAAIASYLIFASEPTAEQEGATRRSAALVETVAAERGTFRPRISVLGQVEPAREVMLSPRISGQVVALEAGLVPGGIVAAGETLLRIDPADFEHTVLTSKSALREIEAELAIEQGRQHVARQEFELLGQEIAEEDRGLILREPQIASIRARIESARAAVARAQLDLDRATLVAPFEAHVLSRSVNVGSQVTPNTELAHLVGIGEYWIVASVPLRDLRWLRFPQGDQPGARVHVRHATAWPAGVQVDAELERLIGAVDPDTRLARVLITVPDPLGRAAGAAARPPLILGTVVQVEIEGKPLVDVVRIERELLRKNDTVWVFADDELEIRAVEVLFSDAEFAYLNAGLEGDEQIVTTNLATVTNGLALRRVEAAR